VAIAALRSNHFARVRPDDHARVLGLLAKRHRDMARLRNTHCTRLHALLDELHPGGIASEMTVTKANILLSAVEAVNEVTRCRLLIAAELVEDITRLDASLKASKKRVKVAVLASGTTVPDVYGIGPICAAMIIGHVRDVGRFLTKAHFATYNATAPIEASSGGHSRHRLKPPRESQGQSRPARRCGHPAPKRHRGSDLLRPQDRRRQVVEGGHPLPQAPHLRPRLRPSRRRRPAHDRLITTD
jgi:transposase